MSTPSKGSPQKLHSGSLKLWHLIAIGLAYFSLAPAIYFNMGFMESDAGGPVMPLLFAIITVGIIPTAISFAVMNNRRPSAGSGYTWLWESVSPPAGLWLGWVFVSAYFMVCALYPPIFGLFFNSFLEYFGVHTSFWTGILGGLLIIALVWYMTSHNVRFSSNVIGVLMLFEAGFIAILALIIVVEQGKAGNLSFAPFNPAEASKGVHGIALGAIFAFLSMAAVDSIAPLAEEANTPRSLIPLATVAMTLIAGLYWTLTSYGFAVSVPVSTVERYVSQGQVTPVYPIAGKYIGAFKILVPITAFTAVAASFGASILAASRLLYALARESFAPPALSRLHPRHGTPWKAELAALIFTVVALFVISYWQDRSVAAAGGWVGEVFVFFILIAYIAVNLANIVYHLRFRRESFNWLTTALVPALGIVIDGYILYYAFFRTELGAPFKSGSSVVILPLAWLAIGLVWVVWIRSRRNLSDITLSRLEEGEAGLGTQAQGGEVRS